MKWTLIITAFSKVAAEQCTGGSCAESAAMLQFQGRGGKKAHHALKSRSAALYESAVQLLKKGATQPVLDFAKNTLEEIVTEVLPAISREHSLDKESLEATFAHFAAIATNYTSHKDEVVAARAANEALSAEHATCRGEQKKLCEDYNKCEKEREDLWADYTSKTDRFLEAMETTSHCAVADHWPDFASVQSDYDDILTEQGSQKDDYDAVVLAGKERFDAWDLHKAKKEACELIAQNREARKTMCDVDQRDFERATCNSHSLHKMTTAFVDNQWSLATDTWRRLKSSVQEKQEDRKKEYASLKEVECLLDKIEERGGQPCDEAAEGEAEGDADKVMSACRQAVVDLSQFNLDYPAVPAAPEPPVDVEYPCTVDFEEEHYGDLTGACHRILPCRACDGTQAVGDAHAYTALEKTSCGWGGDCGNDNQAFINDGERSAAATRHDVASCMAICNEHEECGGFNFVEEHGKCYFRKSADCNLLDDEQRDCYTKTSTAQDHTYTEEEAACEGADLYLQPGEVNKLTFRCGGGLCIPKRGRCNGHSNCGDGSDELHCNEGIAEKCSGNDCSSSFECPEGTWVETCESIPANGGDGIEISEDGKRCIARGADHEEIRAKATCSQTRTFAVPSDEIFLDNQDISARCPDGSDLAACHCHSPWKVSMCGGESTFEPEDGVCRRSVPSSGGRRRGVDGGAGSRVWALCQGAPEDDGDTAENAALGTPSAQFINKVVAIHNPHNNRWLRVNENKEVDAHVQGTNFQSNWPWEEFRVVDFGAQSVGLWSESHQRWLKLSGEELLTDESPTFNNGKEPDRSELFHIEEAGSGLFSLKSSHEDRWIRIGEGGHVDAAPHVETTERHEIRIVANPAQEFVGRTVGIYNPTVDRWLRMNEQLLVDAPRTGSSATHEELEAWERFQVVDVGDGLVGLYNQAHQAWLRVNHLANGEWILDAKQTVEVHIGNSGDNTKCVDMPQPVHCTEDAGDRGTRINEDYTEAGDTFKIWVSSDKVCAKRTDSGGGWGMHLRLQCAGLEGHNDFNGAWTWEKFAVEDAGNGRYSLRVPAHGDRWVRIWNQNKVDAAPWSLSWEHQDLRIDTKTRVDVLISSSTQPMQCVDSPTGQRLFCERHAGDGRYRLNSDYKTHPDTFEITVDGTRVCARRTDASNGWGMKLQIQCATEAESPSLVQRA